MFERTKFSINSDAVFRNENYWLMKQFPVHYCHNFDTTLTNITFATNSQK